MISESEVRALALEAARQAIEDYFGGNLGEIAARAINERRRARGMPDLEL